jgi:hypothetical protein
MQAAGIDDWHPPEPAVIAQVGISRSEVEALCDGATVSDLESGLEEFAVFRLDDGELMALYRHRQNQVPGYTLLAEQDGARPELLSRFLIASGLAPAVVTWIAGGGEEPM